MKQNERARKHKTYLDRDIVLAGLESRGEELGERIGLGAFNARGPGLGALVAEEHVAVVCIDGAGELGLEHLRPLESVLLFVRRQGGEVIGGHC